MATVIQTLTPVIRLGLLAAFVGIGVLGVVLILFALTLEAHVLERIVVILLGLGAVVAALGYGLITRNRPV